MRRGSSCVIRVVLGAALVMGAASGVAMAETPTPEAPTPDASPTPTPEPTPTPTPTPTPRYELSAESGKVTTVGEAPAAGAQGDAIVRLNGAFVFDGPLDFASSTVTLHSLLAEAGGAGELLQGFQGTAILPTTLLRRSGSASSVVFRTPGSARPSIRLSVRRKPAGIYLLNLKISRATIPNDPALCTGSPSTTLLDAALVLDDGTNPQVTVAGAIEWLCELDSNRLRIAAGAAASPSGNQAPRASVRTNLLTRETGQPSLVLLDGANSSDADGTIASYTFRVTARPSGQLVYGPVTGPEALVTTTLPPGDYTVSLVVTDDLGASSSPGTRGLSIK